MNRKGDKRHMRTLESVTRIAWNAAHMMTSKSHVVALQNAPTCVNVTPENFCDCS